MCPHAAGKPNARPALIQEDTAHAPKSSIRCYAQLLALSLSTLVSVLPMAGLLGSVCETGVAQLASERHMDCHRLTPRRCATALLGSRPQALHGQQGLQGDTTHAPEGSMRCNAMLRRSRLSTVVSVLHKAGLQGS